MRSDTGSCDITVLLVWNAGRGEIRQELPSMYKEKVKVPDQAPMIPIKSSQPMELICY